ncbi:ATP-binding protein [Rummeliibacillus suwonensis]|uniref:ATP-binding protein n=1 Tax=Rummeliibacillus suwonensis TaxID=1306154 RepID=UPI001FD3BC2C|nr:ATP-binding protein [Rummeliibacillus suwonensis]
MINNPFNNRHFLGYVNHVSAQYIKVHFPSSILLNKTIFSGEEFSGGFIGSFVTIEGEDKGFIGKISELDLPEKERLSLSEKAFQSSDFHPTAKVEILLSFDYYNSDEVSHSLSSSPNIGSKVFICPDSFIQKYVLQFGSKNNNSENQLLINLGSLISNKETKVNVNQQAIFSRHCAVVGTTGGGKSWSISKLLEGMIKNNTKAILIDPTGEYSTFKNNTKIESVILGEDCFFSYKELTIEDLFFLVKPAERTQAPKLLEAIRSLKCVELYKNSANSKEFIKDFLDEKGYLIKEGQNIKNYERFVYINYDQINSSSLSFDIEKLEKQIVNECIWPTIRGNNLCFGGANEQDLGNCMSLISRIGNLLKTNVFNSVFDFKGDQDSESLTDIINKFISDNQTENMVLRIGFENLGYEFQAREIIANAIGKFLLQKARNKCLKDNPVVLFIDEAHQFLNQKVVDQYFESNNLSAFEQIAKESRKYGLFLCIATQMPRDIPVGTLSQMGTFLVHRLINYNDKEAIRQACSTANSEILSFLPMLGEGEAILTGVNFPMPLNIKVNEPEIKPDSSTPHFKSIKTKDLI